VKIAFQVNYVKIALHLAMQIMQWYTWLNSGRKEEKSTLHLVVLLLLGEVEPLP
jgi:hypothetical protein